MTSLILMWGYKKTAYFFVDGLCNDIEQILYCGVPPFLMMEFATPSAAAVTNAEEMVLIVSITRGSPFCAITSLTFFHWELSRILSRKSLPSHVKEPTPKLHKLLSAY